MDHGGGHGDHGGGGGGDGGGHGDHGGDSGSSPGDMCSMNMLFNWDTKNVCVVFESWKIDTPQGMVISLLVIIALAVSYELLRARARQYDDHLKEGERKRDDSASSILDDDTLNHVSHPREDEVGLLSSRSRSIRLTNQQQLIRSLLYMTQVFVGFFLMLIFMTYNGFLMIATTLGAGIGYFYFARDTVASASKPLSCH
ncbi:hypothetical protein DFQ27_004460 [Actinomortierella ambigua]|uniref:Copper transport protein n=1 Tax=Actinomortierella ambigua TaxID=1343610 RepID=A0A9P6QHT3_9FUNG|nr:hypothetical protein DFQ27_004460 [Actinomortierella ambigua]